jgi:hypothetical protein
MCDERILNPNPSSVSNTSGAEKKYFNSPLPKYDPPWMLNFTSPVLTEDFLKLPATEINSRQNNEELDNAVLDNTSPVFRFLEVDEIVLHNVRLTLPLSGGTLTAEEVVLSFNNEGEED